LYSPYYQRSGWPVSLVPLHEEALRRVKREELSDEEFYPCDAQAAGMEWREANPTPVVPA
jgi:hypothetical protein